MAKVSNGTFASLPAVEEEIDELMDRRSVLAAEMADLDRRIETLRQVRDFLRAESADVRQQGQPAPGPRPTKASRGRTASKATGANGGRTTRDVIVAVLGTLPPGTQISTSQLHQRMVAEYGYSAEGDTVRRSAQRMSERGDLVKVGPGMWQTLPDPAAGDSTS